MDTLIKVVPNRTQFSKGFLALFLFLYWRSLPFSYHFRFLGHVLYSKIFAPRLKSVTDYSVLNFRAWPDDWDFNMHMNNSSYNKICDFARYSHLAQLGFPGNVSGANGGVYMRFKRSIQLWEAYSLHTRIISWDDKWIFIEHCFEIEGRVKAAGLVKIVILGEEKPLKPKDVFEQIGYECPSDPPIKSFQPLFHIERLFGRDFI